MVATCPVLAAQISNVTRPGCHPVHVLSGKKNHLIRKVLPAENTETKSVVVTKTIINTMKNLRFMEKCVCLVTNYRKRIGKIT
jgi:hypothetical protein